jgi:23S rRNA U2552 (ribose-2'-O)-methylase RlmE/FtsJ
MTCQIGDELDEATSVLTLAKTSGDAAPRIMDMGMAPGGFTSAVLKRHPTATVRGITLPPEIGGLEIMLPMWRLKERIQIEFLDVTLLADEMGISAESISGSHPDSANFSSQRPFLGEEFDLIFCGASVQRTHPRAKYRESRERLRLTASQLVMALQRVREGGSLVVLLHKAESWCNVELINIFTRFSNVFLFKPKRKHAIRSSFYMVATKVRPRATDALSAIRTLKDKWEAATFGTDVAPKDCLHVSEELVRSTLADFGSQFVTLATPVWKIQANGLRIAPFLKKTYN